MELPQVDLVVKSTASVRDKLKKRREALGSILSGISSTSSATTTSTTATTLTTTTTSSTVDSKSDSESVKKDSVTEKVSEADFLESVLKDSSPPDKKLKLSSSKEELSLADPKKKRSSATNTSSAANANKGEDILQSLLSAQSAKEKADQQQRDEILELLGKPTAKEKSLIDKFKSQTGGGVRQFCSHSTKKECMKVNGTKQPCDNLHFAKIIQPHTEESLGDCSFLNTCFHMDTCKYIHYEVDADDVRRSKKDRDLSSNGSSNTYSSKVMGEPQIKLVPPQWIQCDLRNLDLSVLGKFAVLMADPPWDIHMELPYGTMSDDEMRRLPIPNMQDEGLIFLWVTGRAMELGRECLKLWGYERVDEIIWVKTNQLQRIIRTGRTGHWLNHGKEHCLVGMKGKPKNLNRGLDCDVIVAEVRATSHKPDEIYGIIERLSPGTRKCELFGRPHNVQPNWVTLGNQLDGVVIHDEEMLNRWNDKYIDGYKMTEGLILHPRQEP